MTIQLNLKKDSLLEDMKVLKAIFEVDPCFLRLLRHTKALENISSLPYSENNVIITITMEEYFLLCDFLDNTPF